VRIRTWLDAQPVLGEYEPDEPEPEPTDEPPSGIDF
jgi:hypothetical protein